jgi:hypothetical protein
MTFSTKVVVTLLDPGPWPAREDRGEGVSQPGQHFGKLHISPLLIVAEFGWTAAVVRSIIPMGQEKFFSRLGVHRAGYHILDPVTMSASYWCSVLENLLLEEPKLSHFRELLIS